MYLAGAGGHREKVVILLRLFTQLEVKSRLWLTELLLLGFSFRHCGRLVYYAHQVEGRRLCKGLRLVDLMLAKVIRLLLLAKEVIVLIGF